MNDVTKRTPGPWTFTSKRAGQYVVFHDEDECPRVAVATNHRDARLIAAAPELLEAAEAIANHLNGYELDGEDQRLADLLVRKLYPATTKAKGNDNA